jgi:hypothetical protein
MRAPHHLVVPVAVAVAALAIASSPAGASPWRPVALSSPGEDPSRPALAVAPSGGAVAAWIAAPSPVQRVIRVASSDGGGSWSAPRSLAVLPAWSGVSPGVAINGAGDAAVRWVDRAGVVWVAVRPRDEGNWLPAAPVSEPGAAGAAMTIDPSGAVLVAWADERAVRSARRAGAGGWSPPREIARLRAAPRIPVLVALDANRAGDAVVWWNEYRGPQRSAVRRAGEAFSRPEAIPGSASADVDLAVGPSGEVVALAARADRVEVAVRPPGGAFGRSRPIVSGTGPVGARVATSPAGSATAVWAEYATRSALIPFRSRAAERRPGGRWRPLELPAPRAPYVLAGLAVNARGEAVVTFLRTGGRVWDEVVVRRSPSARSFRWPERLPLRVPVPRPPDPAPTAPADGVSGSKLSGDEFSAFIPPITRLWLDDGGFASVGWVQDGRVMVARRPPPRRG